MIITDAMWYQMCSCEMSAPVPLEDADLSKPFLYQRAFGVSYVASGYHQVAMSLLLAFNHNLLSGMEVARVLGIDFPDATADYWLENTPGAAFLSSVGNKINIASFRKLSPLERWLFVNHVEIF
jgi:hypothetical protein